MNEEVNMEKSKAKTPAIYQLVRMFMRTLVTIAPYNMVKVITPVKSRRVDCPRL